VKNFYTFVLFSLVGVSALAQSNGLYGEVAYGSITIKDTSSYNLGTWKPSVARFTLGKVVTDNIAVEGFVVQGLAKSSVTYSNVNIELEVKTSYGLALRPFYKVNEDFEVFGRVGKYVNKADVTASSTTDSNTYYHTLYSIGTAYKINNSFDATLDYTKLSNKGDANASLIGVGLRYNF
jgi:hypothetical protein